jgi:hypothetical protein
MPLLSGLHRLGDDGQLQLRREAASAGDTGNHLRVPVERDHRFRSNVIIDSGDRDQAEVRV